MRATSPHREPVRTMVLDGKTTSEIAQALNIPSRHVVKIRARLRQDGDLPDFKPSIQPHNRLRRIKQDHGKKLGSVGALALSLDADVLKWLFDETPYGALLTDTIRSILIDAYHEENDP